MKKIVSVHIRDLSLKAIIGTLEHERKNAQGIVLNISFEYDASLAAQTDALGHAIDYDALTRKVVEAVERSEYFLLERLAAIVLEVVMSEKRIVSAKVTIDKPQAIQEARSVAVELSANRDEKSQTLRCY